MTTSVTHILPKEVKGVALVRSPESLQRIVAAYRSGETDKKLRSYMLPDYQLAIIDQLCEETGESKAGVIRGIIDEWVEAMMTKERKGQ